ncbi:conserved repeat domain-containing protein/gliding motility-associated C-terminal domain-containing protein [Cyclobacterium lianum]|uniref:Conserved repeat domain-containing protein/gliding motility-associated C-terminal domain-containing protein n=1 Tax=Cyclobacterium lianum TaxID=388280 RepID=A0A1M7PWC5_9BACT|nr:gliding motility-associated C-terminal domain-containing protein [Cyclobacterium lianum]SHN21914.1 conserved repeat domain-containing protein/gliding motility-associated C-terminal domain-containing protein [Cyclobacterium lianum]
MTLKFRIENIKPILPGLILFLTFCFFFTLDTAGQQAPVLRLDLKQPSCPGNGEISAVLENVANPADLLFELYLLPESAVLASNSSGRFTGLIEGSYRVTARYSVEGEPQEISAEANLMSTFESLSFTILSEGLCENDLSHIEVITDAGNPLSYELRGDLQRPAQDSPLFENIPAGSYTVVVTDECGDRLSQSFEIRKSEMVLDPDIQEFQPTLAGCGEIAVGHLLRVAGAEIAYPLAVLFTVQLPDGQQQEIQVEVDEGAASEVMLMGIIPFYPGEEYSYDLQVTDNCDQIAILEDNLINRTLQISEDVLWGAGPCGQRRLSVKPLNFVPPFQINFSEYPDDFDPSLYNEAYPGPFEEENIFFGSEEMPIPFGQYTFMVEDACGNTAEFSKEFRDLLSGPATTVYKGCGPSTGSLQLNSFDYQFTRIEMVAGPEAYSNQYPIDLSENISQNDPRRFFMNSLPAGNYEFVSYTTCDTEHETQVTVSGVSTIKNEIGVDENCGSFNLSLDHQDNLDENQTTRFGIQKFDPTTGEWVHPETGRAYQLGEELTGENAILLVNRANNINLSYHGELRLVKSIRIWKNGQDIVPNEPSFNYCLETLDQFEIQERSTFSSINTFQCVEGNYELSVSASGYPPINFKIVERDGLPFEIDNGEDPLFKNLEAGRYRLQLEDNCGNLTNTTVQIRGENLPKIIPENLCEGENGSLSVKNLDFLDFEWFNVANPDVILSTGPSLEFSPFNLATHEGVYGVRLNDSNPESCLNETLEFTIDEDSLNPEPGEGQVATVCKGEIIDLFDYLDGPFSDYGTWEEISDSGALIGNTWATTTLSAGSYTFEYNVTGICSGARSTRVTINLSNVPPPPQGEPLQQFCMPGEYTIGSLSATGEAIRWFLSPEGGTALPVEEALTDGQTYYADQTVDGCPSDRRLAVQVNVYPELVSYGIGEDQTLYQMEVPEILIGESPEGGSGNYTFQWEIKPEDGDWTSIGGATNKDFLPPPLLKDTRFRRITTDDACGTFLSNEVTLTIEVARIQANDDTFGPLINFENNLLPSIFENDSLKMLPAQPEDVAVSVLSIRDEAGNAQQLVYSLDENGVFSIPEDTPPNTYILEYRLCQSDVPGNCDEAEIRIEVVGIELEIQKTVDRRQAVAGEIVDYTIEVTNNSIFAIPSLSLREILPEGLILLSATPEPSEDDTWIIPQMAPEETLVFQLSVLAAEEGSYTNQVRGRVENFDETISSETLEVRPKMIDLSVSKTATAEPVRDGDNFVYQIRVGNNGLDAADNVRIVDFLPQGLQYLSANTINAGLAEDPVFSREGQVLAWQISSFPVGASLDISLTVKALRDGRIRNRAEVSGQGVDTEPENNTAIAEKNILSLFIPNVIKPDFDGRNDTFVIEASHKFEQVALLIFNRWGDLVFAAEDYQNDWDAAGLLAGTYYYQVKGMDSQGNEKEYKGWVQVIK